ncbi:MAG TPA: ribosome small subunit-dependent GTPase A [Chlamydiales bacterium]|nr:ribosome small subunit-dependent GTPase A [Chlamydiales bacterium]
MTRYDEEEAFHAKDRKQFRKERKLAQQKDRSKFKKSDQQVETKEKLLSHLPRGRVIAIGGEGVWVEAEGEKLLCSLKGALKKKREQVKNLIAVGDWVRLGDDFSIEQIEERISILSRTDISGHKQQLIAANIDQVFIVASVVNPPLKPALIDRYLIAAEKGNIHPIIIINKTDLLHTAPPEEIERYQQFLFDYERLGFPILSLSIHEKKGLDALCAFLKNKTSVFSGQSGVGKSSLLNISFGMNRTIGSLTAKTAKGSHTTTQAELLSLPDGGYCIDTPGVRSFGIWEMTKEDLIAHFQEITALSPSCRFLNCAHINEPECAVHKALEEGLISPLRYESYSTLLQEIAAGPNRKTWS